MATAMLTIPVVVGLSRGYRGMHYPADVVVSALGGWLWLFIVVTTLRPVDPRPVDPRPARDVGRAQR